MEARENAFPSIELLEKELKREQRKNQNRRAFRSLVFTLLAIVIVAVIAAALLLPVLQINGASMSDTLNDGDVVVLYRDGKYEPGDVIGFYYNDSILIKRVIATAGNWVDISDNGEVYVNGALLSEPYVSDPARGDCDISFPYQVPAGMCFVMGDNRAVSIDSRNTAIGCIRDDRVAGRLMLRLWPLSDFGRVG